VLLLQITEITVEVYCSDDNGRTNHRHRYQLQPFVLSIGPHETIGMRHTQYMYVQFKRV